MRKLIIFAVLFAALPLIAQSAFPNLLTGQTPRTLVVPSGWTNTATEDFENGTCNTGAWCGGNFNSIQYHNDGNPAHTHSLGCTYGNQLQVQDSTHAGDCGGFNWNKFLPVGTKQVYISFYEYVGPTFRMNDEFFLARFHWDTGNGQPAFREAILDYFQDSSGTYNSTDATLLWNIQGQPYYQNKLPSNTVDGNHDYTFTLGTWNQWEIYSKFSTVSGTIVIPGTVTVSASGKTYTRTTGSWIADGVIIGSSPHFLGFSNSDNNGDGSAGGGGNSYFVTSVTDTVMTVYDPTNRMVNEGPVSSLSYQIDKGDGAYALYKNGTLVAYQNDMVLPGKYDFSSSNTTISLMESYSKLIWRGHVNGNCETWSAPPPAYAGTCASSIGNGGCGFERMDFGWNASGFTRLSGGTTPYTVPIDCAPSPMPNPPVFERYIDDIIVLTTPNSVPVGAATVTAGTDTCGNAQQTVKFPGYAQFTLDSGTTSTCGAAGTSGQGITSYFDLKNDPTNLWDFGAADTGMFEHQWGIKNQDGTTRYNEIKEGPMAITVAESNNVRVKLTQSGAVRSVGLLSNTADCCMTMTKSYVFYRHGSGTAGSGASKVYTQTTINYNNGDSQAPLTTAGTSTGINYYDKMGWWKVSGEVNNQSNPCGSSLQPFTLSPWNIIWPGAQLDNTNKSYILYAPANANSANATEFLPGAPCTSPGNVNPGPENTAGPIQPGTIMLCNGASSTGCTSQSASGATVKANFLQIENEQSGNYMSIGTQNYFLGGLRTYIALASQTFPTNTPRSWTSVGYIGDNGITSDGSATPYVTEYKTPPTITFTSGSGGSFDPVEGYWTMAANNNSAIFSANAVMHSPAFNISSYSNSAPSNIVLNGSTLTKDVGYVAVKTDSTHLLLQILQDVSSGAQISIGSSGGQTVTVTPASATIPVSGSQQFSASPAGVTWSLGTCTGTIDPTTGAFTASASPETCTVIATLSGNSGSASVTSQSLVVTPSAVSMNVGGTQQFSINFPSQWSTDGGTVTGSGAYTAPQVNGTYHVTATALNGGATATATITVTGQQTFIPLTISPTSWNFGTVATSSTTTKAFTVSNIGSGSVTPTVTLTGSGAFTISANTCTGAVSGSGTCTVTIQFHPVAGGSYSGNLQITDTAGGNNNVPLSGAVTGTIVAITPKSVTLPKLGTQQFTATATNSSGVSYAASIGSISSTTGQFTAPNSATTGTVTATATDSSGATDSANVTVQAVTVSPASVSLQPNAKQQFTANFSVNWSVSGTCSISTSGLLTAASSTTTCTVTATAQNGGSTATAFVSVVGVPPSTPGSKGQKVSR
jgi:hypothetical protein